MANSKLIVVEGPQGAGKTTITDYLRYSLSYTNLYRMCGTSDTTKTGLKKATDMYENLVDYIEKLENLSINLVFDRTFFTEVNLCRFGKKEYSFTEEYNKLLDRFSKLDFDIYYVTLYLEDESLYNERLSRSGKAVFATSKFGVENSKNQQRVYLEMAEEIRQKYPNINVLNIKSDRPLEEVQKEIREKIGY